MLYKFTNVPWHMLYRVSRKVARVNKQVTFGSPINYTGFLDTTVLRAGTQNRSATIAAQLFNCGSVTGDHSTPESTTVLVSTQPTH